MIPPCGYGIVVLVYLISHHSLTLNLTPCSPACQRRYDVLSGGIWGQAQGIEPAAGVQLAARSSTTSGVVPLCWGHLRAVAARSARGGTGQRVSNLGPIATIADGCRASRTPKQLATENRRRARCLCRAVVELGLTASCTLAKRLTQTGILSFSGYRA